MRCQVLFTKRPALLILASSAIAIFSCARYHSLALAFGSEPFYERGCRDCVALGVHCQIRRSRDVVFAINRARFAAVEMTSVAGKGPGKSPVVTQILPLTHRSL
jgi:hypothetical protein